MDAELSCKNTTTGFSFLFCKYFKMGARSKKHRRNTEKKRSSINEYKTLLANLPACFEYSKNENTAANSTQSNINQ
ncbi:MAG: hypothetical protein IPK62_06150 [Bacteroidetes bacterium]|nr:hypothetical protein [Bacteroidota bacterium]